MDTVHIGCRETVIEDGSSDPETHMIVGPAEADPMQGKISHESPVGMALIGKRAEEKVKIQAPAEEISLEILDYDERDLADLPAAALAPVSRTPPEHGPNGPR